MIGGGPAGLGAAVYAASEGLNTLLGGPNRAGPRKVVEFVSGRSNDAGAAGNFSPSVGSGPDETRVGWGSDAVGDHDDAHHADRPDRVTSQSRFEAHSVTNER